MATNAATYKQVTRRPPGDVGSVLTESGLVSLSRLSAGSGSLSPLPALGKDSSYTSTVSGRSPSPPRAAKQRTPESRGSRMAVLPPEVIRTHVVEVETGRLIKPRTAGSAGTSATSSSLRRALGAPPSTTESRALSRDSTVFAPLPPPRRKSSPGAPLPPARSPSAGTGSGGGGAHACASALSSSEGSALQRESMLSAGTAVSAEPSGLEPSAGPSAEPSAVSTVTDPSAEASAVSTVPAADDDDARADAAAAAAADSAARAPPPADPLAGWDLDPYGPALAPRERARGVRLNLPQKFLKVVHSPLFDGKDIEPAEWEQIFRWTGRVWLKKDFPPEIAHYRRNEAAALGRLLDLMIHDTEAEVTGPFLMKRFEVEQPVYVTVRRALREQVALKCREHGEVLETIFRRYDEHLSGVQPVFQSLHGYYVRELACTRAMVSAMRDADSQLFDVSQELGLAQLALVQTRDELTKLKVENRRLELEKESAETRLRRLQDEVDDSTDREDALHASVRALRARAEAAETSLAKESKRAAVANEQLDRMITEREEVDEDAHDAALQLREAVERHRELHERFQDLERNHEVLKERLFTMQEEEEAAMNDRGHMRDEVEALRKEAAARLEAAEKAEAEARGKAERLAAAEASNAELADAASKADRQRGQLEFERQQLERAVESARAEAQERAAAELELKKKVHSLEIQLRVKPSVVTERADPQVVHRRARPSGTAGSRRASTETAGSHSRPPTAPDGAAAPAAAGGEEGEEGRRGSRAGSGSASRRTSQDWPYNRRASHQSRASDASAPSSPTAEARARRASGARGERSRRASERAGSDEEAGGGGKAGGGGAVGQRGKRASRRSTASRAGGDDSSDEGEGGGGAAGGAGARGKRRSRKSTELGGREPRVPHIQLAKLVTGDGADDGSGPDDSGGAAAGRRARSTPTPGARASQPGSPDFRKGGPKGKRGFGGRPSSSGGALGGGAMHADGGAYDPLGAEYDPLGAGGGGARAESPLGAGLGLGMATAEQEEVMAQAVAQATAQADARHEARTVVLREEITRLRAELTAAKTSFKGVKEAMEAEVTRRKQKESRAIMLQKQLDSAIAARSGAVREMDAARLHMATLAESNESLQTELKLREAAAAQVDLAQRVKELERELGRRVPLAEHEDAMAAANARLEAAEARGAEREDELREKLEAAEDEAHRRVLAALDEAELRFRSQLQRTNARADIAEQEVRLKDRRFDRLDEQLAEALKSRDFLRKRLHEAKAQARERNAELTETIRKREEALRALAGAHALGSVHGLLEQSGVYAAKAVPATAQLAEKTIQLAVALDEAHEHNERLTAMLLGLKDEGGQLHSQTNSMVALQLDSIESGGMGGGLAAPAAAGQGAAAAGEAGGAAPTAPALSVQQPAEEDPDGEVGAALGAAFASVAAGAARRRRLLGRPESVTTAVPGAPAAESEAGASSAGSEVEGEAESAVEDADGADSFDHGSFRSGRGVRRLVAAARRVMSDEVATEVAAIHKGHQKVSSMLRQMIKELQAKKPATPAEILALDAGHTAARAREEAAEAIMRAKTDAEAIAALHKQLRELQARTAVEQLELGTRVREAMADIKRSALQRVADEGEWLKMWATRRVHVEQSVQRALPLVLDDIDRATERLSRLVTELAVPEGALSMPESVARQPVPPPPDVLEGGDFSLILCYRSAFAVDRHRQHVFNYSARDGDGYDDSTRAILRHMFSLLQLNPARDAQEREWMLRAGGTARPTKPALRWRPPSESARADASPTAPRPRTSAAPPGRRRR